MPEPDGAAGGAGGGATNPVVERGRDAHRRHAWAEAYDAFSLADQDNPLTGEDLDLLAMAAVLTGRDEEFLRLLERAHNTHLSAEHPVRAARSAFWLGFRLVGRGEIARASGWFARARRLLEREEDDCVEQGYLLLPLAQEQAAAGDPEAAYGTVTDALRIGTQFGEADLVAFARHVQGRLRIRQGRVVDGLALLDETMVAVTAGELSPMITGVIYCSVIDGCQQVYALDRAREWTTAMAEWCEAQPEMLAFGGTCLAHRAEILQLHGAWREALEAAQQACERRVHGADQSAVAAGYYQQAEVLRLRGETAEAEEKYKSANEWGMEPQPGLALLRVAQGRSDAAAAAIRRVLGATTERARRTRLLPASIEIMLAAGQLDEARTACRELEQVAESLNTPVVEGFANHARGAVQLAEGGATAALISLRRAGEVWQQVEAPYLAARVRVLVGLACRALGDEDGGTLELDAARAMFEQLGAVPDATRAEVLAKAASSNQAHPLTRRELQVLRLVASGKTNKAIAKELGLSEKTVDRHVSNIFTKLDVPSRAAATAAAFKLGVVAIPHG